ncbi:hypothetical protein RGU75_04465 [Glaciimonas sp. CA11.2]|nr:hypothetical protein [Glaciimonas sp. CA11.2]MDY7545484.1 hypothetical protein [Glaciimonas sp. CA11.2]
MTKILGCSSTRTMNDRPSRTRWANAYSGQRDRSFWPIVTAAPAMLLRG